MEEQVMKKKYRCLLCGAEFEVEEGEAVVCPVCGAGEDMCEEIKEDK